MEVDSEMHPVFLNDPLKLLGFVNKYVKLELTAGGNLAGYVYTIDPVSEIIIIGSIDNESLSMKMIMKHNVKSIVIDNNDDNTVIGMFENLFNESIEEPDLVGRRKRVQEWFGKHRLPIREDGDNLVINDIVTILPPYRENDCISDSEIILKQIQCILNSVPLPT